MGKIIFVNATATTEGGALTILKQFLEGVSVYSNKNIYYYIFCSLENLKSYENNNIRIISNVKGKKWIDRIKWDLWGLKKWSEIKDIRANLVISFQNTGVYYYKDIRQLIYLHQSIPFYQSIKWSFFNRNERLLWFYKNIYKKIIKYSLRNNFIIVVQTELMKNAVVKQFNWEPSKIAVIKPAIKKLLIKNVSNVNFKGEYFHIFYPANTAIYKNHELIINVLKNIKDINPEIYNNIMIHFTFSRNSNDDRNIVLINLIKNLELNDNIKFEGKMPYERVLTFYTSCDLMVFPSYIESFPLPLIEAAAFGLPILVSDFDYAREIIGGYNGAKFLDYKDAKLWAENIILLYSNRVRYKPYNVNCKTSWKDFFELINNLLYKESISNV